MVIDLSSDLYDQVYKGRIVENQPTPYNIKNKQKMNEKLCMRINWSHRNTF